MATLTAVQEACGCVAGGGQGAVIIDKALGAIYWTGASISEKEGGENRLLFDAQIMAAREDGCLRYETGQAFVNSADSKEAGLSRFKRSFGAELFPFYRGVTISHRFALQAIWRLREMIQAMRRISV